MSSRLTHRWLMAALVLGLCLAVSGCSGKVNKANFDKINSGMSEKEVTDILGPPTESGEVDMGGIPGMGEPPPGMPTKIKQSVWKDGSKVITIQFLDNKVQGKIAGNL